MKSLVTTLCLAAIVLLASSCKARDPETVAAEQAEIAALAHNAQVAIEKRSFVLEANRLILSHGQSVYVQSNTNFISLDGDKAVVQIAFVQNPGPGLNGIGGITVEGRATNVKVSTDKKGNTLFSMNVAGAVSTSVSITVFEGSNQCSATVVTDMRGRRVTFTGDLFPREFSNVFTGRAVF